MLNDCVRSDIITGLGRWNNLLLGPFVLTTNLVFLLGGEVVLNVEGLTDLLGGLALDHVGDSLATDIKESLDIEIVGGLTRISTGHRSAERILLTKIISKSIS